MENTACCLYEFITAERSFSCRLRAPLKSGSHITVKQLHLVFKTTLHIFMKPQPSCTCVGVCSVPSNELLECIRSYSVHAGGGGREGRREGGGKIPPLSLRNNSHQAERAPTPGQSSVLHTLQDTHRLQPNTLQSSSFIFIFIKSIIDMIFDTCSQCIVFSLVVSKMIIFNLKTTLLIQNLSSGQMN